MKNRLSKTFFIGSYIGGGVLNIILSITIMRLRDLDPLPFLLGITLLNMIYLTVVGCLLWYRAWASIQDDEARTTPGKAVGFMFIPFFNLYWAFQAIYGFAKDCNAYISRHKSPAPPLPESLFLTATILILCGIILNRIPVLGILYGIGMLVIMVILTNSLIDTVNVIREDPDNTIPPEKPLLDKRLLSDPRGVGVVAIALSVYAVIHNLIFLLGLSYAPVASAFLGILSLGYWATVIYLGWLCQDKVLRVWAMCLPVIPILLQLWNTMKFMF